MADRSAIRSWVDAYERVWRVPDPARLAELFSADATYSTAPYEPRIRGIDAISAFWEAERQQPDDVFTMTSDVVAADDGIGVVRVEVRYGDPVRQEYRDLWIIALASDGKCKAFEEWPFWPPGTSGGWASGGTT
ncbi:MAG: hypothetical protein JWL83_2385 [Actinomycetia bacterium]|nr:hypothetical protein [Actinomycetes bacterium]